MTTLYSLGIVLLPYQSTVLIPKGNECYSMSSVLEVKMINEGDD